MKPGNSNILTINGGSSSIKFALYAAVKPLKRGLYGTVGKAAEGRRTPRRWRESGRLPTTRNVLECASPLALVVEALYERRVRRS